jgi:hypothetical protein
MLYLVLNNLGHDKDYIYEIYQKRWYIEVHTESIKHDASLAKSQTKKIPPQSNHIFAVISPS